MRALLTIVVGCALAACTKDPRQRRAEPSALPTSSASSVASAVPAATADAAVGRALVEAYECNRCHEGTGLDPAPRAKSCVACHQDILAGRFEAPEDALESWRGNIVHLRHVPTLENLGAVLRADWLAEFLVKPHDLRPNLPATMPRLAISTDDARHIAAYLVRDGLKPAPVASPGDATNGRVLFAKHGCGKCHAFSFAERLGPPMVHGSPKTLDPGVLLAPDLRHTRARVRRDVLAQWIADPQSLRAGATMPKTPMSKADAADIAAYILDTPLADVPGSGILTRLPVLEREVGFDEVSERVFKKICWHCHAQPDFARGDGGPGMSGGFGFAGRKLDLSSYEAIAGGYLDADGETGERISQRPRRPTRDGLSDASAP